MRPKIHVNQIRKIVKEELDNIIVKETVDHNAHATIVSVASKLLDAIEQFKEKAPVAAINAVTPHMSTIEKALENMVSTPGSYVAKEKKVQKVSLKSDSVKKD